nr:MAG TPA: hypothetical protein [Caudoviricetes sp.]
MNRVMWYCRMASQCMCMMTARKCHLMHRGRWQRSPA